MTFTPRAIAPSAPPAEDPASPIRRCTFRRVTAVPRGRRNIVYDVACLYPTRESPVPLGNLESARGICDSCSAHGIFRPDED